MTPGGEDTEVGLVKTVEDLDVHTVAHFLFLGGGGPQMMITYLLSVYYSGCL